MSLTTMLKMNHLLQYLSTIYLSINLCITIYLIYCIYFRLYEPNHCDITRTFGIKHYAGKVVYDTTNFLGWS